MAKTSEKQKEILAQFYSNFALAWVTFGLINPVFNPPSNLLKLFVSILSGLIIGGVFLKFSLKFVNKHAQ